ncbi:MULTISPECIES: hypothetical protein [unclassified Streptomyces]|uniref:hypothetical protein n=1 Tax=unclassified Streptomyces TaxID=2593676 RepID=UPI001F3F0DE7|nr:MULTISPECIES: hypothetical protein [unclassified Streptomyces]
MTTPLPPRHTDRRTTARYVAVPRELADPARTGRRWVRRRARGMTADAAAAALDVARFDARQNSRHEDLALDERGPAELGEWERIAWLLADAPPGTVYDPDTDDVVRDELAADAAAAAPRGRAARSNADRGPRRRAPGAMRTRHPGAGRPVPGTKPSVRSSPGELAPVSRTTSTSWRSPPGSPPPSRKPPETCPPP